MRKDLEDVEQILESCIQTLQELDHVFFFASDQYCKFNLEYVDICWILLLAFLKKLLSSLFLFGRLTLKPQLSKNSE